MDRGKVGVGNMSNQDAHGPAANASVGKKGHVDLALIELEDAPVEGLNAAPEARDELEGRELGELLFGKKCRRTAL